MVTPAQRRTAVTHLRVTNPVSTRRACEVVHLARARWYHQRTRAGDGAPAVLCERRPRRGRAWAVCPARPRGLGGLITSACGTFPQRPDSRSGGRAQARLARPGAASLRYAAESGVDDGFHQRSVRNRSPASRPQCHRHRHARVPGARGGLVAPGRASRTRPRRGDKPPRRSPGDHGGQRPRVRGAALRRVDVRPSGATRLHPPRGRPSRTRTWKAFTTRPARKASTGTGSRICTTPALSSRPGITTPTPHVRTAPGSN